MSEMDAAEQGQFMAKKAYAGLRDALASEDACVHEWRDIESMGNNEYRTDVCCVHCRMPGERDHADDSVFWPAT